MKVSVVTISFRDLDGLRKTVESVRSQKSAADIEHIIVDGGSGQAVVEYLESLDPQPAYWQSQPDEGRYHGMNQGIARSTGDIVWLMHSGDCFSDPDAIDYVVRQLDDPRTAWGYGKVRRVGANGEELGTLGYVPFDLRKFTSGMNTIPHQGTFIGADLAAKLGPYDETFGLAADQVYLFRAALEQLPVALDRIVCDFDATGAGTVRPIKHNFRDLRRAWDLVGYYPHGNRTRDRLQSRAVEYLVRSIFATKRLLDRAPRKTSGDGS